MNIKNQILLLITALVFVCAQAAHAQDVTIYGGSAINIGSGNTFKVDGGTFTNSAGGSLKGNGTLDVTNADFENSGVIGPGASPGILNITGGFKQTSTGALNIEIGGNAGTDFDQLDITGPATLGGDLNVELINGFEPVIDDSFQVVTYNSSNGDFVFNFISELPAGLSWATDTGESTTTLSVVSVGLPSVTLSLETNFLGNVMEEVGGVATVTATLSNTSTSTVTVDLSYSGEAESPEDYAQSGDSISITPGNITGMVTLTAVQDNLPEDDEDIIVDIVAVDNGTEEGTQQVVVLIQDNAPPELVIDNPECGKLHKQIFLVEGTASDDNNDIQSVEFAITPDDIWYFTLDPFEPLVQTETWHTANGTTSWNRNISVITFSPGTVYKLYVRATDGSGNQSTQLCYFIFVNETSETNLSMSQTSESISLAGSVQGDFEVWGALVPAPDYPEADLSGLEIKIEIMDPAGDPKTLYEVDTDDRGAYIKSGLGGIDEFDVEGTWTIKASFDAAANGVDDIYEDSSIESTVFVGESAGYAIIVQGRLPANNNNEHEGIESHNKTTNRIYQKFIDRGFKPDDIIYFNYDTSQNGVDARSYRGGYTGRDNGRCNGLDKRFTGAAIHGYG